MLKIVAIFGSGTLPGRLCGAIERMLESTQSAEVDARLIDLRDLAVGFTDGRKLGEFGDDTPHVVAAIAGADAVVLASLVYRGTYSGVLKNLLDHVPHAALFDKPVGVVVMGTSPHHQLGIDWHLRAALAWYGAVVPPTSVYLTAADFEDGHIGEPGLAQLNGLSSTLLRLARWRSEDAEGLTPRPFAEHS